MTTADFLLELRSEEIPARMQAGARNDLAQLFSEELEKAGLATAGIETFSSPRRLALIARGLPLETEARSEEIKGPRSSALPQAIEGFLRKTGLGREQLQERDGVLFAQLDTPGQPTCDLLGPMVERIVRGFPWPKSMRWGAASVSTGSLRWVRPLHGIVAILGEEIVPIEIEGICSGATTLGHRFHHSGAITIGGAADYAEKLRACHVIVDQAERERIIREGAAKAAADAGLTLVEDEGLVVENAGLTEWPVPLLGRFDPEFLDVPPEVIQLTARVNQKYFVCSGEDRGLAPAFVCTANIDSKDGGAAIVEGNRRVLAARLSDARFFWEQDLKVPLEEQAKKLSGIVFHEKLGTLADKVERVAKLARWLVEEGIVKPSPLAGEGGASAPGEGATAKGSIPPHPPTAAQQVPPSPARGEGLSLGDLAERAARLAKADLVTGMVGEFPELQGVIGGYLARAQGEPDAVADAIRDHYKPVGQGDEVPTALVTVAVALADKLDSIFGFFSIDEKPTGSKDPFGLRRAGLGVLGLIQLNNLRIDIKELFTEIASVFVAKDAYAKGWRAPRDPNAGPRQSLGEENFQRARIIAAEVALFLRDRLVQQQRDFGIRGDLISAAFEGLGRVNDFVSLLARVKALQSFVETKDGADLLTAYKRAANILKKEKWEAPAVMSSLAEQGVPQTGEEDPLVLVEEPGLKEAVADLAHHAAGEHAADLEPQERALIAALDAAEPKASAAVEGEDFTGAMEALASLRGPIDSFFNHVTVNDPDPAKRARRLNLLARFRDAVHRVADFSKIEG